MHDFVQTLYTSRCKVLRKLIYLVVHDGFSWKWENWRKPGWPELGVSVEGPKPKCCIWFLPLFCADADVRQKNAHSRQRLVTVLRFIMSYWNFLILFTKHNHMVSPITLPVCTAQSKFTGGNRLIWLKVFQQQLKFNVNLSGWMHTYTDIDGAAPVRLIRSLSTTMDLKKFFSKNFHLLRQNTRVDLREESLSTLRGRPLRMLSTTS